MDLSDCIEIVQKAEATLRRRSAEIILSSSNYDQECVNVLLNGCKKLSSMASEIQSVSKRNPSLHEVDRTSLPTISEDSSYPLSFYANSNLYKVGLSEPSKSDGIRRNWWKSVSIAEACKIMRIVSSTKGTPFRRSDIKRKANTPEYRVDVVITALKRINAIKQTAQRGYYEVAAGTVEDWSDSISALPIRTDLLKNSVH